MKNQILYIKIVVKLRYFMQNLREIYNIMYRETEETYLNECNEQNFGHSN